MRVDPQYVDGLVSSLGGLTATQQTLSTQLSSGLRVTLPGDDPVAVGQATRLASAISRDDTFVQTATTTGSLLQVSDAALGSVVTQLTSAISLAVQGNNGTLNASDRSAIAQQLSGIRDEVFSLANTSYQGSYVFAGSRTSVPPYALDTSTTPATATYNGDLREGSVTTPTGQKIGVGLAGSQVFSAPGADVLGTLNGLIADFASGSVSSASQDAVGSLKAALSNVSLQRSVLDTSLSNLQATSSYAQTDATNLKAAQGALVSSDTATVATQLSAVETQKQALLSVIAADEKGSLFDNL